MKPNPNPRGYDDNESASEYAARRRAERLRTVRVAADAGETWALAALAQMNDDQEENER